MRLQTNLSKSGKTGLSQTHEVNSLMGSIKQILRIHGYQTVEEMEVGDHITVEASGFMDLVIEKIGDHRISVGHYYEQHGDLLSDPEIVFKIQGSEWIPVRYTQHPHIHRHNEHGLPQAMEFAKSWDLNLKRQGFAESGDNEQVNAP